MAAKYVCLQDSAPSEPPEKKRQEVTSRIAKYFAPSFLFMPFLLDTRANNVPKKSRHLDGRGEGKKNFVENIHRKLVKIFCW